MHQWLIFSLVLTLSFSAQASPDWSKGAVIATGGRPNPYSLSDSDFAREVRAGRLHALHYPVDVSGVKLPYAPLKRLVEADAKNPILKVIDAIFGRVTGLRSFDAFEARFGLLPYPADEGAGAYFVPFADSLRPEHRMGFTIFESEHGRAVTVSCAQCHSGNLFGRKVIGLTNRFPRANEMFVNALEVTPHVSATTFRLATEATPDEVAMYKETRRALAFVGAKRPAQLGLDTSLAQVALSLAKRDPDPWATRSKPQKREDALRRYTADSKPSVWWNVKYKNRWLSDGSIVSGNPIFTNFIWNELGRGTDLRELDLWFQRNEKTIEELTTAVFASEAPRFTDFFSRTDVELESAKRGQKLFETSCARCHGTYEKAWDRADANSLSSAELLATTHVDYDTRVVNVGTDPQRYLGMRSLVKLNALEISQRNGIVVEAQEGYVPPPLVGLWARWPYFHNNSVPSLCAVLTPARERPKTYWARDARDPERDFDRDCNGYPSGKPAGARDEMKFDTSKPGLRNSGHDEGIFTSAGRSKFSEADRRDLIHFLQTL